jgi:SecD/SecF fusion protein
LFGGETLKDFAFAMLIGVITGAYSSIFVATPILVMLKEREPKYRQHRARLEAKPGERRLRPVPAPADEALEVEPVVERATVGAAAASVGTARTSARPPAQRPRPKNRRKPPAKRKRR